MYRPATFLKNLIVAGLVKKFYAFYRFRKFIAVIKYSLAVSHISSKQRNSLIQYHVLKTPQWILGQLNPIHALTPELFSCPF
jgi:hypothetical protein